MENLYKVFEAIRKSNLEARKMNNYDKLLENAQALSDYIPEMIEILVTQENLYRKYEASLANTKDENGKYYSNSYCETQAKATENYKEFKKAELTLDWAYATINISKKLAASVGSEYNSIIK